MTSRSSLPHLAIDTLRAAFTVTRWTLGMMLFGALLSLVAATVLLDEASGWVRSGVLGTTATVFLVLVLLVLPLVWSWLGRAHGIRLACVQWLGPRAAPAIALLLRGVARRGGPDTAARPLTPQAVLAALRRPRTLSGPARWLAWLVRWQLDLDRTEAHLEAAAQQAQAAGVPAEAALAEALAADLGERWLQPDPTMLWTLALTQVSVVLMLAWWW